MVLLLLFRRQKNAARRLLTSFDSGSSSESDIDNDFIKVVPVDNVLDLSTAPHPFGDEDRSAR